MSFDSASPSKIPDRPSIDGLEATWNEVWEQAGTYRFDRDRALNLPRDQVFAIDTPPPTASGSLHVGHVFSYTHTDLMARYHRMRDHEVFYPIGWDDNGLPTERRVQNYYGVRGDAEANYIPDYTPPLQGAEGKSVKARDQQPISRPNFIELCEELTMKDEQVFENLFRRLGLSLDYSLTYRTIDDRSRAVAQQAFLRNYARGDAYQQEAPGLWDITFQTAVAQAELEARDYPGAYHRVAFAGPDGPVHIETTRPELLPACVALIAHPEDERYTHLFGREVFSPIFGVKLPVLAHSAAEMDKGAGIAMCCTFGDLTDVQWWRELQLPTRSIITRNGRIVAETPDWLAAEGAEFYARQLAGKTVFSAREAVVAALAESGALVGTPEKTMRKANFFEKGERPLEIVTSRQWYIRNGGRNADLRQELVSAAADVAFHPPFMASRYTNWVDGLNGDWLISRQRFFGVPFPVWYPLNADGEVDYNHPLVPTENELPVDPQTQSPEGYSEAQRGKPGGFIGDPDVMDTWATSSLTPQIATGWPVADGSQPGSDAELFAHIFPMDMRPQGHDIIRTWLFSTMVRSKLEHGVAPWKNAAISGWILDPDRKKMSKSKGNTVVPDEVVAQYGADAVRYWAASSRLGTDAAYDIGQMKVGRRLAIKLLNASKFAFGTGDPGTEDDANISLLLPLVSTPLDRSMLAALRQVVIDAGRGFAEWNFTRALELTESFFWSFCDDYLELVKERAYGDEATDLAAARSARAALRIALHVQLRLLAPFMPFASEEVWSWWQPGSVHRAAWPQAEELGSFAADDPDTLHAIAAALSAVRRAKSDAQMGMRAEMRQVTMHLSSAALAAVELGRTDLVAAGRITNLALQVDEDQATAENPVRLSGIELIKPPPRKRK